MPKVTIALLISLLSGCGISTSQSRQESSPPSIVVEAKHPPEDVFAAMVRAGETQNLKVVQDDRQSGRMVLEWQMPNGALAERVIARVAPIDGGSRVELRAKADDYSSDEYSARKFWSVVELALDGERRTSGR